MSSDLHEASERIWMPVVAPSIWAIHFMIVYGIAVAACGRAGRGLDAGLTLAIVVATIVAVVAIAGLFLHGWRRHRFELPRETHDDDTPEDRRHFLAWTTMLLAGLSLVATAFVALAAVLAGGCA
jgi:hypothetical protein